MPPQQPFDQLRFRLGRILGYLGIGLALTSATMSLYAGRFNRAALPLTTFALALWWLAQLPRKDAS